MPNRLNPSRLLSWTTCRRLTAAGFLALLILGRYSWFPWLKGSLTATRVLDVVPLADPLSGLEVILASQSATSTLLLGMGATLLITLLLGRVFCGWLCPLGLALD